MKLSIITINYNNREGLIRTVKSVIEQSYHDFEYIIIDGGSTDGSKEVIEECSSKIQYWVSETDCGIYNAMNKGIQVAHGEYILFLNSGDILLDSNALSSVMCYLKSFDIISFNLRVIGEVEDYVWRNPTRISFGYFFKHTLPHPATFIRRENFEVVGLYDENLKIVSDWKWFLLAIFKFNLTHKFYDSIFSIFYLDGVSSAQSSIKIIKDERAKVLNSYFPFFYDDYVQHYKALSFIEDLNKSRLYKIVRYLQKIKKSLIE